MKSSTMLFQMLHSEGEKSVLFHVLVSYFGKRYTHPSVFAMPSSFSSNSLERDQVTITITAMEQPDEGDEPSFPQRCHQINYLQSTSRLLRITAIQSSPK